MRKLVGGLAAIVLLATSFALPASAQAAKGTVTVVHGVPGLTVDVYVNDAKTLSNFAPKTVTDPLTLDAATYNIKIRPAGAAADSAPAIQADVTLPAGANASIVAHLDANGTPRLTTFVNDVAPIAAGKARVTVRHTAQAPAVDILVNGAAALTNLSNPNETKATLDAAVYNVAVAPTGTTAPVLGPVDLDLKAGTAYFVYAIGSASGATLDLVVQTVSGLGQTPTAVPTGSSGLAADGSSFPWIAAAIAALAMVGLASSSLRLVRSRRRA